MFTLINFIKLFIMKKRTYKLLTFIMMLVSFINYGQIGSIECGVGGFENGSAALANYNFFTTTFPNNAGPPLDSTYNGNLIDTPLAGIIPIDENNAHVTLVTNGNDPGLFNLTNTSVPRVFSDNFAIRLGTMYNGIATDVPTIDTSYHARRMTRTFTVTDESFDFRYSIIASGLASNQSATNFKAGIFIARLLDINNNQVDQIYEQIHHSNNLFTDFPDNTSIRMLYSGWQCESFDLSDYMNDQMTIEFIIIDNAFGPGYARVYLDDINCGDACDSEEPEEGSINLNETSFNCPEESFTVCGTYTLPTNGILNTITLNIIGGGTTINVINPTYTINNSFCFTINSSVFGANPTGNFEFQANALFDFGVNASIATDLSAIDGPDVSFIDCDDTPCPAAGEHTTISFCSNDDTDYNLEDFLVNANLGGTWSNGDGIFNPVQDTEITHVNYYIQGTKVCPRDYSKITILLEDCSDPCDPITGISVSGDTLTWNDSGDCTNNNPCYTLQFINDGICCKDPASSAPANFTSNINTFDLVQVINTLGSKCFKFKIKTKCSDWSDWYYLADNEVTGSYEIINCFSSTGKNSSNIEDVIKKINLYPNPAKEHVTIVSKTNKITGWELYNIYGNKVLHNETDTNATTINLKTLVRGYYFIKVQLDDGSTTQKNIILK